MYKRKDARKTLAQRNSVTIQQALRPDPTLLNPGKNARKLIKLWDRQDLELPLQPQPSKPPAVADLVPYNLSKISTIINPSRIK